MNELIPNLVCCALGLMAHGSVKHRWLEWLVRLFMMFFAFLSGVTLMITASSSGNPWGYQITGGMATLSILLLFIQFRRVLHRVLTVLDGFGSLRFITGPMRHKMSVGASLVNIPVFVPTSIPHMAGAFIYVTTFGLYLGNTDLSNLNMPTIPLPMLPVTIEQLVSYNGIGLVLVSICGVGIFVSRKPREVFRRLGWEKPTLQQVGIGIGLVAFSFLYDLLWSLYTHNAGGDMATQISGYNSGTFAVAGGLGPAILLALATALCAGIGEETLIRGAIQPVLGIIPAAFLHGILHAQFAHAPTLILQVAIWSCVMGIVRRCTNTTTTIIGHAGFNLVTTFLFAFNP